MQRVAVPVPSSEIRRTLRSDWMLRIPPTLRIACTLALGFLSTLYAARECGRQSAAFDRGVALVLVVALAMIISGGRSLRVWIALTVVLLVLIATRGAQAALPLACASIALIPLSALKHTQQTSRAYIVYRSLGSAVLLFAGWLALRMCVPQVAIVEGTLAKAVNASLNGLMRTPAELGVTAAGVPALLLALAFCASAIAMGGAAKWSLLGVLVSYLGAYLILPLLGSIQTWSMGPVGGDTVALDVGWVYSWVVALVAALSITSHSEPLSAQRASRSVRSLVLVCTAVCVATAGANLVWSTSKTSPLRIFIYDAPHLDTRLPADGTYGRYADGMFGRIGPLCRRLGYSVSWGADVASAISGPDRSDCLILVNLPASFEPQVRSAIREYVQTGGALLLLVDHTGGASIRDPANELLLDWGISVRFDSAKSFDRAWSDGMRWARHPVTDRIRREQDTQIWTGAGLDVSLGGTVLVTGRSAFSDPGDPSARDRGQLGDLKYSDGELLGDIALVASAEPDDGRVLVFGDTSPIQNGAVASSRRLLRDSLEWLTKRSGHVVGAGPRSWLGWLCLLAYSLLFVFGRMGLSEVLLWCSFLVLVALPQGDRQDGRLGDGPKIAHIDLSHRSMCTQIGWTSHAIGGLQLALQRRGYEVYFEYDGMALPREEAAMVVIPAPTSQWSAAESEALKRWVNLGGVCIITSGRVSSVASTDLLRKFDISVLHADVGSIDAEVLGAPAHLVDAVGVEIPLDPTATRIEAAGVAVGGLIRVGAGAIAVIGDDRFLENSNLEDTEEIVIENIEAFRRIIEHLEAMRAGVPR